MRAFLGLVGYYRKFIPAFSSTAAPLTDLTKKSYPDIVNWMPECEQSFTKLKQLLCNQPVLRAPDYNIPFTLQTDASEPGIGAVLRAPDYNIPFTLQTDASEPGIGAVLRAPDYNIPFTLQTDASEPGIGAVLRAPDYNIPFTLQTDASEPGIGAVLRAPDYNIPFTLQTDASKRGIGAVLAQMDSAGTEHPIAYYSRKMFPRECRYSATEQEGLAVVEACEYFLPYLLGRSFTVVTDPSSPRLPCQKESSNGRLARWMDMLRQFTFTIVYCPGKSNQNADALSRQAWIDDRPAQDSPEEGEMLGPPNTFRTETL